ncbi:MAG: hypothetical protein H7835_19820, partial [Magnetococcus sp. XQGC-1]
GGVHMKKYFFLQGWVSFVFLPTGGSEQKLPSPHIAKTSPLHTSIQLKMSLSISKKKLCLTHQRIPNNDKNQKVQKPPVFLEKI